MLEVPDDVLAALRLPPGEVAPELRKELALALYQRQALGFGKARELARLAAWEFAELLARRGIPRQYGEADLDTDLAFARSGQ